VALVGGAIAILPLAVPAPAKKLDLEVPSSLSARADEVIE